MSGRLTFSVTHTNYLVIFPTFFNKVLELRSPSFPNAFVSAQGLLLGEHMHCSLLYHYHKRAHIACFEKVTYINGDSIVTFIFFLSLLLVNFANLLDSSINNVNTKYFGFILYKIKNL